MMRGAYCDFFLQGETISRYSFTLAVADIRFAPNDRSASGFHAMTGCPVIVDLYNPSLMEMGDPGSGRPCVE
jgi:hypothetical protein